ncbi:MAG: ABC transporter transmembrane domain-containing protein [Pseudomonadota bacterium]
MRPHAWPQGRSLYTLILKQTLWLQGIVIVLGLVLPFLAVLPLDLQRRIIDEALPASDLDLLGYFALLYAAAVLGRVVIKFLIFYLRGWIAEIVARVMRVALIDAQRRRAEPSARAALGPATSVLTAEVDPLGGFASEAVSTPLIQGGTLLGVFGYMAIAEPRLAVIGYAGLVLEAIITPLIQTRINRLTQERIQTLRYAGGEMIEAAAPREHAHLVHTLASVRQTYGLRLRQNLLKATLKALRKLLERGADIAVLVFGAVLVMRGEIGLGIVVAFLSGLREVRGPWSELISFYRRLTDAQVKYRLVGDAIRGEDTEASIERALRVARQ